MEHDLIEQITLFSTINEYSAWEQRWDEFIEFIEGAKYQTPAIIKR